MSKNFKISTSHYGEKISIKVDKPDIKIEEYYDLCRQMAYALGYGKESIKEYFND
tara:strand:- start:71 stop:235 length:165 start_codon:yes stop_codon:yes gene_type:complete